MKLKYTIPFLLAASMQAGMVSAQDQKTDSLPVIRLSEITIHSTLNNMSGRVQDYVMANRNASTEDILSRLPEINMIRRGSYGMEPQIRSYHSGQMNLLIDGMRIHGACTDKMDPASIYIEPQNLEGIQVNNSGGSQFGSTIGGTINLALSSPMPSCEPYLKGQVSSGYQAASKAWYESAVLQYARHGWALRTNVTYRKSADYRSGGGGIIPYSSYEKLNYGLNATYALKNSGFLKMDVLMDDAWYIGYPALPMDVGSAKARIVALSVVDRKFHPNWHQTELKVYANRISHAMDDTHRQQISMHMDMPGLSETVGALASATQITGKKTVIRWRADISSTFLKASMTMYPATGSPMYMLTWPDNRMTQSGIGAAFRYKPDSAGTWLISARADQFSYGLVTKNAKDQLSVLNMPTNKIHDFLKNLTVEYTRRFKHGFRMSFSVAYAERMPTASELFGFYLFNAQDNYDYLGNSDLSKEQAFKTDYQLTLTRKKLQLSWNLYASRIRNYISGVIDGHYSVMTPGAKGVKQYLNRSYVMMAGSELALMIKPGNGWQWLSVSKYHYAADNNGHPLPQIAPFRVTTSLKKEIGNFSVQFEAESAARQNRVSSEAGEQASPSFWLMHVRSSYSWKLPKQTIRIDAGLENIFDKNYHEHLDWNRVPRAGRNVYAMITCNF